MTVFIICPPELEAMVPDIVNKFEDNGYSRSRIYISTEGVPPVDCNMFYIVQSDCDDMKEYMKSNEYDIPYELCGYEIDSSCEGIDKYVICSEVIISLLKSNSDSQTWRCDDNVIKAVDEILITDIESFSRYLNTLKMADLVNTKDAFLETAYERSKIREVIFMDDLLKILKENNNISFPDDSIIDWDEPVDYYNYFSNLKCYTEMLENEMSVYEFITEFIFELVNEDMLECSSTWKNVLVNSQVRQTKGVPDDIIEIDEEGKGDLHIDIIGSKHYIRFMFEIPILDSAEKLAKIDKVISRINEVVDFGTIYHTSGALVYSAKLHYNYRLDLEVVKYYICDILNEVNAIHGYERDIQRELS